MNWAEQTMLRAVMFAPFRLQCVAVLGLMSMAMTSVSAETLSGASDKSPRPLSSSRDLGEPADGIAGLVVNQTLTGLGNEFYKIFSIQWSETEESRRYSLSVQERLSRRSGNFVNVYFGQKRVFNAVLPNKYVELRALGEKAVGEIQAFIVALALEAGNEDIAREEY